MSKRSSDPRAARHTCYTCGELFWLSEDNHDEWGPVCPNCGALS
ncbi:MAG: hypothetical protein ACOCQ3_02235 [Natronomonas sp.]